MRPQPVLSLAACDVDLDGAVARWPDREVVLSELEVALLRRLAHDAAPVPPAVLLREVWGYAAQVRSRAVTVLVSRLRSKIEADPANPTSLLTVPRQGYVLVAQWRTVQDPAAEARALAVALRGPDARAAMARVGVVRQAWVQRASTAGAPDAVALLSVCAEHALRTDLGVPPGVLLAAAQPDVPGRLLLVEQAAWLMHACGSNEAAEALLERELTGLGDTLDSVRLTVPLVRVLTARGQVDAALRRAQDALPVAERLGAWCLMGHLVERVGAALSRRRDGEATGWFEEAVEILAREDDLPGLASARHNLGTHWMRQGDIERGRADVRTSVALFEALGDERSSAFARLSLAMSWLGEDAARAAEDLGAMVAELSGQRDRKTWCCVHLAHGASLLAIERWEEATAALDRARHLGRRAGLRREEGMALRWLGWLAHRRGELSEAASLYGQALALLPPGLARAFCETWLELSTRGELEWTHLQRAQVQTRWLRDPESAPRAPWRVELAATYRLVAAMP